MGAAQTSSLRPTAVGYSTCRWIRRRATSCWSRTFPEATRRSKKICPPLPAGHDGVALEEAVRYHGVAVRSDLPPMKAVTSPADIDRPETVLDIELLIAEPPVRQPACDQKVVAEEAVPGRGIAPRPGLDPLTF